MVCRRWEGKRDGGVGLTVVKVVWVVWVWAGKCKWAKGVISFWVFWIKRVIKFLRYKFGL